MGTEQQSMGASETELTGRCRRNVHIDDKASRSHRCLPRSRPVSRINRGRQTPNSGCSPESYWVPRPRPHSQCLPMVGSWQPLNHDSRPENDPRIRQESAICAVMGGSYCCRCIGSVRSVAEFVVFGILARRDHRVLDEVAVEIIVFVRRLVGAGCLGVDPRVV